MADWDDLEKNIASEVREKILVPRSTSHHSSWNIIPHSQETSTEGPHVGKPRKRRGQIQHCLSRGPLCLRERKGSKTKLGRKT